jgi:hypothetical protein
MRTVGKVLGILIALPFALALLLLDVPFKLWAATRLAWQDEASMLIMPPASLVQDNQPPTTVH